MDYYNHLLKKVINSNYKDLLQSELLYVKHIYKHSSYIDHEFPYIVVQSEKDN